MWNYELHRPQNTNESIRKLYTSNFPSNKNKNNRSNNNNVVVGVDWILKNMVHERISLCAEVICLSLFILYSECWVLISQLYFIESHESRKNSIRALVPVPPFPHLIMHHNFCFVCWFFLILQPLWSIHTTQYSGQWTFHFFYACRMEWRTIQCTPIKYNVHDHWSIKYIYHKSIYWLQLCSLLLSSQIQWMRFSGLFSID